MRFSAPAALAAWASVVVADTASPTATDVADVEAAAATAISQSPVSHVKGKTFDRYVSIWFENTDYDTAAGDPNFAYFASKGLTLENLFAVTHPSQPNYLASITGDYFGLNGDWFNAVPENISSTIDLLEDKGISWAMYEEDMPYTGFQGVEYINQETGANDYVRKHNPAVMLNSVVNSESRLERIKNTTLFFEDLEANTLPQWMFITPNMTDDGHDSSVTTAGTWLRWFLDPLLTNPNFMNNTLVLLTFDENENYAIRNNVFSVLLGDALPASLVGQSDTTYYNHYSEIATVEANWNLSTLGRWDVGANVFSPVAQNGSDKARTWSGDPSFDEMFFNYSYDGIFNHDSYAPQPVPNVELVRNGRSVLGSVVANWSSQESQTYYKDQVEIPDGFHPPVYPDSS
ncbi:MAG: hypothetical protein M1818_002813 [Claussenomyces sp. TS43310]|nr:MAG: hypothetical protein M1818_002813 [Claussenomyces sp. TS43310]